MEERWLPEHRDHFYMPHQGGVQLTAAERSWIKSNPTIRIAATTNWPPFEEETSGGGYEGVTADFIRAVAKKVGLKLDVVFDHWDNHLKNLKDKKIDVAPGLFDTPERRAFLLLTEPFVELSDALYVSEKTMDILSMDELKGRRVAVERSYAMHEVLAKEYPEAELVVVETTLEALKTVITGKADAYVGNQPVTNYLIRKYLLTGLRHAAFFNRFGQSLHIGVRNDWPMLHNILQKGLESISAEQRRTIFGRWIFGTAEARESVKRLRFTEEEKSWLQDHPVIRVHNERNWPPFNFNEGGNPRGFSVDYMNLLADKIGIRVEYVSGPDWGIFLDMIHNKALDVMLNIVKTPDREAYIHFTEPYVSNPPVVIARKPSDIKQFNDLKGREVCIPEGFFYQEVLRRKYPAIAIETAANQEDCLKVVSEGRADATLGGVAIQAHLISKLFLSNLEAVAGISDPDIVNDLRIGVRSDWPIFRNILDKAIASVSSEELSRITEHWIKVDVNLASASTDEEASYSLAIGAGAAALGGLLLVFLLQFVLRRLVKKDASHLYQSKELKTTGLVLVVLFLGVVALAAWITVREAEKDTRAEAGHNLLSVLTTTHETLKAWAGSETNRIRNIARNPGLISLVEELLFVERNAKELSESIELQAIRNWLKVHFGIQAKSPFSIITPDGLQVAAKDDVGLGRRDIIAEARPEVLRAVIDGEIRFVSPLSLKTEEGAPATVAQFFMAPIKDADGKVIAAFALESDPKEDFSRITQLGRVGTSGETYAVDEKGRLITASRYDAELRSMGLIGEKSEAMLNLVIRDPGVNLKEGARLEGDLKTLPLTKMAAAVTQGNKGMNVDGYRDYRGVPVIGVWLWDESLNIGLGTELDEGEAMAAFRSLRKTMIFILGATVLISLGLMGLSVWIGQSAAISLTRSRDEAEDARLKAEEARWEAEQAEEQIRMKVAEIERFNRLAMGREERIIELKEMVNGLREKAGEGPQFKPLEDSEDILYAETGGMEPEEAHFELTEMIDLKELQNLLDHFCNSVGIAAAIIDLKGEVLAAARWQRACTDFHRVNEQSCARCIESDTDLALKLRDGEKFSVYKCKNGLTDAASPIEIEGKHLANVFIGQFLLNKSDTTFFKEQAKTFGYDENDYMAAIGEVPVIPEKRLPDILGFLAGFARLVASLSVERLQAQKIGENQERERAAALNLAEDAEIARDELSAYKDQLEDLVEERTAELQVSEERTRLLLDSVGEGIFGVDLEGKITFVNPAVSEMLRYEPGELIGEQAHQLFHHTRADGSHYPVEECWMYKSFTEGDSYRIDNEVLWRKDGTPLDIEYLSTPIRRHDKLDGAVITFMDISERKAAQEKLRESQQLLESVIENSAAIIFSKDNKGRYTLVNKKWEELTGMPRSEALGKIDNEIFPDEVANELRESDRKVLVGGEALEMEELVQNGGRDQIFLTLKVPLFSMDGKAEGICGISTDITGRKEAEELLRKSEAQMRDILASSPIGAGITDIKTGEMIFANPKQEELFGVGEGGFKGISASEVYASLEDRHEILTTLKRDGKVTDWEVQLRRLDGQTFWALLSASEMIYENRLARLAWFYDITERKKAEDELQQIYEVVSDSIQYASHIQRSVLTGEDMMAATMREHMVLWEPRDVVGGDIYWCHIWGDGVLVVLGDCTGHGVPGAFMTLIATGALDRAMADVPPGQVGNLIQRMHQVIQIMLKQHGDRSESDDGLELGACFMNPDMTKLTFAGARFPLFQLEGGQITEYKGTKKGIGYRGISQTQTYDETVIDLNPGMTFYMSSDGYLDQVGGEKRRMFGKKRFKQLLIDMEMLDFEEQKRMLMQALADYQGEETRRDDVSIVAFRI